MTFLSDSHPCAVSRSWTAWRFARQKWTRRGARRFGDGSNVSILVKPQQFRGLRPADASGLLLAVTPNLEFLDEALQEVEEASRWYERRSASAAIGFTEAMGFAVAQHAPPDVRLGISGRT
jgi:hypothetical protein